MYFLGIPYSASNRIFMGISKMIMAIILIILMTMEIDKTNRGEEVD
jgi:hypothetical protein